MIAFRVLASPAIGGGHLARCLALAEALRERGRAARFVLSAEAGPFLQGVAARGFEACRVDGPLDDPAPLLSGDPAAVVCDGYALRPRLLGALRACGMPVAYVDDHAEGAYDADLVVNHHAFAVGAVLALPAGAQALLGPSYALVRRSFRVARARSPVRAEQAPRRVLVTLGGSDPARATLSILRWLGEEPLDVVLAIDVLLGGGFAAPEQARGLAANVPHHAVRVLGPVPDLAELLEGTELVIGAAGTTALEVACVGRPLITLAIADNQLLVDRGLGDHGLSLALGPVEQLSGAEFRASLAQLVADGSRRGEQLAAQRAAVDGSGPERVAAALEALAARGA